MNAEQTARLEEAFAELGFEKTDRGFILDLSKISKKEQDKLCAYSLGGNRWLKPISSISPLTQDTARAVNFGYHSFILMLNMRFKCVRIRRS